MGFLKRTAALCGAAIAFLAISGAGTIANAADMKLVAKDTLTVAFNGDMPGTGWQDGKLIGLDGELMGIVAANLGFKITPALMEWAGEIASLKARRVDIMHGMMGWNDKRIKVINISDPIYYGGANITQKKIDQLEIDQRSRRQENWHDPRF